MVVISSYSRAQAIEDGVLADLSAAFPYEAQQCFKYNVCCTAAVWGKIEAAVSEDYDLASVVYDVLALARYPFKVIDPMTRLFRVTLHSNPFHDSFETFKAVCGPGDDAEPVITIMEPEED